MAILYALTFKVKDQPQRGNTDSQLMSNNTTCISMASGNREILNKRIKVKKLRNIIDFTFFVTHYLEYNYHCGDFHWHKS